MTHPTITKLAGLAVALCAGALSTGCATKVPFTHELRTQHDLSNEDLTRLQFYLSTDVTLRREARTKAREINGGELLLTHGKVVEEIVIEQDTPGVAVGVLDDTITISFAEGSDLAFSIRTGEPQPLKVVSSRSHGGFATPPPSAFPAEERDDFDDIFGSYFLRTRNDGTLTFQGVTWETATGSTGAHLVIDAESLDEVVENRTVLGGRRIGDSGIPYIPVH